MEGDVLEVEQIRALSRLPSREVLYGQLVGVVASPVSGLVRTLNALIGGLAVALGGVREKKESGEIPAGEPPPAEEQAAQAAEAEAPAAETAAEDQAEPEQAEPAQEDDNQADASAEVQPEDAEANPTKED
jgi:large subunit ribosomal protein L10